MADYISNPLLALIKEQGLIDDLQLEEVLQEQTRSGKPISQILQDFGIVETETQLQIVATHLGTEVVDLSERELPPEVVKWKQQVKQTLQKDWQLGPEQIDIEIQ